MSRNIIAISLSVIVFICTIVAVLGIWDLWEIPEHAVKKLMVTLFVILCSGAVTLFIYAVVYKKPEAKKNLNSDNTGYNEE